MKKILAAIAFLALTSLAGADTVTLTNPETLVPPEAVSMKWYISHISAESKTMRVQYQWFDAGGQPLWDRNSNTSWHQWECRDIPTPGTNAECVGASDPFPCCTGAGTGTCDGLDDSCFSDVFTFSIRQQDVGTPIGVGLRTLIFNQFKQDILTPGNDGTFNQ